MQEIIKAVKLGALDQGAVEDRLATIGLPEPEVVLKALRDEEPPARYNLPEATLEVAESWEAEFEGDRLAALRIYGPQIDGAVAVVWEGGWKVYTLH